MLVMWSMQQFAQLLECHNSMPLFYSLCCLLTTAHLYRDTVIPPSHPLLLSSRIIGGGSDGGTASYHVEHLPRSLLYDVDVEPLHQRAVTVGQDGHLRVWDVATGSMLSAIPPEPGAGGCEGDLGKQNGWCSCFNNATPTNRTSNSQYQRFAYASKCMMYVLELGCNASCPDLMFLHRGWLFIQVSL